jgi:hypothetical protein
MKKKKNIALLGPSTLNLLPSQYYFDQGGHNFKVLIELA